MKNLIALLFVSLFIVGCSSKTVTVTPTELPEVYVDVNATHQVKNDVKISLFKLDNYTDTPRAGQRATNIVEGVFLAKEYKIYTHMTNDAKSLVSMQQKAQEDGAKYFLSGGVSEWRYKTGIDGEPAVSLRLNLYKTENMKLVWSATGAHSDWGTGSIGTTAQELIESMTSR